MMAGPKCRGKTWKNTHTENRTQNRRCTKERSKKKFCINDTKIDNDNVHRKSKHTPDRSLKPNLFVRCCCFCCRWCCYLVPFVLFHPICIPQKKFLFYLLRACCYEFITLCSRPPSCRVLFPVNLCYDLFLVYLIMSFYDIVLCLII